LNLNINLNVNPEIPMTTDSCCTIVPYFTVNDGKLDQFRAMCEQFVALTDNEAGVLFYGFTFNGDRVHCREGYGSAEGVLAHLDNVGELLGKALQIANLDKLEIHGPESELSKLREPLADLNPEYWVLDYGFRR
jgi:hypothetical protein